MEGRNLPEISGADMVIDCPFFALTQGESPHSRQIFNALFAAP
jgi:hypothetical protein